MKKNLKLFLLTVLGTWMAGSAWADAETGKELYLVGDATPVGWSNDGSIRQTTKMTETSTGVYVWTGLLKHGNEGFKICDSSEGWDGYRASSQGYEMSGESSDNYHKNGDDNKWNPTNTDWQCFTITLDTNNGTLSWAPGNYEVLTPGDDGYISISTAEELNKLAFMYRNNVNNKQFKAKLTADINYTAYKNGNIASLGFSQELPFRGEFDGQNHTITIDIENVGSSRTGLFAYINAATIKNLVVEGSATSARTNCVGGLGGRSDGDGTLIENVVVKTAVSFTGSNGDKDATCGGFFANMEGKVTLKNCAFYGSITTPAEYQGNGGLVGWAGSGTNNKYENCIVAPTSYTQIGNSADFARNNPSITNCYKVVSDDATLASGKMTYKLNGNKSDNDVAWHQKLGTDAYPMPFGTDVVYAVGDLYCDGTSKGGALTFSNNNESNRDPHHFNDWGFCDNKPNGTDMCNELNTEFMTLVNGYYEIGTKQQLNWFAVRVNGHDTYHSSTPGVRDINGKLTADIDFSDQTNMIGGDGQGAAYQGTFDGQGHKVTLGYAANAHNAALFRTIDGAHIMNLVTDGSISNEGGNCAGGIFGGSHGSSLVENCVSYVALSRNNGGDATFGGIGAYMHDNGKIKNCAFYGSINTPNASGNGGLLGYANGGGNIAIENCIVNATAFTFDNNSSGSGRPVSIARNTGNVKHTYVVNAGNATQNEAKIATAAQVESGELAFIINNESESGMAWYQKLGDSADAAPLPFGTAIVYQNGDLYCDGMSKGSAQYSNTEGQNRDAHNYGTEWGLCINEHDGIVCDDANPNFIALDNGYYPLSNQKELNWFALFVNQGKGDNANAKLTADIDMTGITAFPGIANSSNGYRGTLDGNGHIISNLTMNYPSESNVGLIRNITAGAHIKNITIANTCYFKGDKYSAAFVGHVNGNGTALLEQLGNEATVETVNQNAGGIVGCNTSGQLKLTLLNCYNAGAISSGNEAGGLSGWLGDNAVLTNCYNMGTVTNGDKFARGNSQNKTNCFDSDANYSDGTVFAALFDAANVWRMDFDATPAHPVLYDLATLVMKEDFPNRFVASETADVKVYRAMTADGEWNTLCLPFDLDGVNLFDAVAQLDNAERTTLNFKSVTDKQLVAGKAYLVKPAADITTIEANSVELKAAAPTAVTGYTFTGIYEPTAIDEGDLFVATGNKLAPADASGNKLKGFRAYFDVTGSGARATSFVVDDMTTGIIGVDGTVIENGKIYNLNGQKVQNAQKGLYIVNGKKVVIK